MCDERRPPHQALVKYPIHGRVVKRRSRADRDMQGGASLGIGLVSLAKDLGITLALDIRTDATAAICVCKRRSLGKIRHLATADLWVQDKLKTKKITLSKIHGPANPADILTKHVDRRVLETHLRTLSMMADHGRAASAPTIHH